MSEIYIPGSNDDYECPFCGWGGCDGTCEDWPLAEVDEAYRRNEDADREKAEQ